MSTYPAIAAGQRITASLLTSMLPVIVSKSVDEQLVSSTALQNDDDLVFPVAANAHYIFNGYLSYEGQTFPAGPCDLQADWVVPSGTDFAWQRGGYPSNNSTQVDTVQTDNATIRVLGTFGPSTNITANFSGRIITSGAAGTCQLRWAQNVSCAVPLVMRAGSWVRVTRIQ